MTAYLLFILFTFAPQGTDPRVIEKWQEFESSVRDQKIPKGSARQTFRLLYQDLKRASQRYSFSQSANWVFPLEGYSRVDVGRGGFRPDIRYGSSPFKGYDFYDGNLHGGHPGYDIFIHDKNHDCVDDRTGKPVFVLAPVDLLILSTYQTWTQGSELRGGNYIWAIDPIKDRIYYFAHLGSVRVSGGTVVRAGDKIGTVGRTGKSAIELRSPSHLHLMVLTVKGTELVPFDYWDIMRTK